MENNIYKKKFWKFFVVIVVFNLAFVAILAKLFNIQILEAEKYKSRAEKQHLQRKELEAKRGKIYDRNGVLLATSIKKFTIAVDPTVLKKKDSLCLILSEITHKSQKFYKHKINKTKGQYVELAWNVIPQEADNITELNDRGIRIIPTYKRNLQYGSSAIQIIGLTGKDNKGLSGIELYHDEELSGENGYMIVNRDNFGRLRMSADLPLVPAKDGNSIMLTIDIELQNILEYELRKGVINSGATAGTAVALHPETGEILAIASYPSFDPYNRKNLNNESMRIRGITDVYEPGSTFKMIVAASALEEGIVSEEDTLNGYNGVLATRYYTIRDVHGLGNATFREAVEHSSNIIFSSVANEFADHLFYRYMRNFGFGAQTGVDLPGEVRGNLPKPENYNLSSKRYMGHGYGLSVTPVQLANAYAAIANGGELMKPYVVKKIFDNKGDEIKKYDPEKIRRVISEQTAKRVNDLFIGVVDSGTGKATNISGFKIAGKTGTSQKINDGRYSKSDYIASFAGYYPAEKPQVSLLVMIDEPRKSIYGGSIAAPIFKNITTRLINSEKDRYFGITESFSKDSLIMPDFIGLTVEETRDFLNNEKFQFTFNNEKGLIKEQTPEPYTKIARNEIIELNVTSKIDSLLIGTNTSKAINLLHAEGFKVETIGFGNVKSYEIKYSKDSTKYYKLTSK